MLKDYFRVLKIAKRPTWEEYQQTVKLTGIGILAIGAIGLIVTLAGLLLGV